MRSSTEPAGGRADRCRSATPSRRCTKIVIVVDASVLVAALADDDAHGDVARARLRRGSLVAPELIDLETASVIRRHVRGGQLSERRGQLALTDLADLPMGRVSHRPLVARCWELKDNLTIYDAVYVALAELLG